MAKAEKEKIYVCEAKRTFVAAVTKVRVRRWIVKPVADVIGVSKVEVRCKDCHGEVRLHAKHVQHGPSPHIEHRNLLDLEYCPAGMYFRQATDGRLSRLSSNPVQ